jgi:hypothetical protein
MTRTDAAGGTRHRPVTDFRISVRSVRVHDTWIAGFYSASYIGRITAERTADDSVLLHLMRRGSWRFARPDGHGGRPVPGTASAAEARILMAHARTVGEAARNLTPVGLRAARDALLELAKGALWGEFDDAEPLRARPRGDGVRGWPPHRS